MDGPSPQNHNLLTILFYIRITDKKDDEVVRVLKDSILYVLQTQHHLNQQIVGTIYIENWVYKLIQKDI